ncbi:MAG: OmpA family protein [Planctomycetes bacterium]|nr:OmpA family protein [Planctomycetota bacterium]
MTFSRPLVAVAAGLALAAAGCKSSPCAGPSCYAEQPTTDMPQAVAAPAPVAPMPARSVAVRPPAPPPPASPRPDPEMQSKIDVLRTSIEAQERRNSELEGRIREAVARNTGPTPVVAAGGAGGDDAARRMADELRAAPGTRVMVEGSTAVAVLTDSFDSGSDKLKNTPDLRAALKAISAAMARHPEARVTVSGHTDSSPIKRSKWADNDELSKARAEVVAKELASAGVPREKITVRGVGSKEPIVSPEKTSSDRAKNRRVEVQFAFGR